MYLTAKRIENGIEKGRAIYYEADDYIEKGDFVKADLKGEVTLFRVQRINCEPPDFECKKILEKVESDETGVSIEAKITPAEIVDNFDVIKERITEALEPYKNIVVTEDTLSVCKQKKAELSGMAKQLDNARRTVKTEFMKPYVEFEEKCRELRNLIEEVAEPISEGIKDFRELERQEKLSKIKEIIREEAEEENLPEKYVSQIEIPKEWLAKTKSLHSVMLDVQREVSRLKVIEKTNGMKLDALNEYIHTFNQKITSQEISIDDFPGIMDMELGKAIEKIRLYGEAILRAESVKEVSKEEKTPKKEKTEKKAETEDGTFYTAEFTITGTLTQLRDVKAYLTENSIAFNNTNAVALQ